MDGNMEQPTVSELIDDLQPILRKFENDCGLVLGDAHQEQGTVLGDNYVGQVVRMTVSGKRGDGSPYRKSIVTKIMPVKKAFTILFSMKDLFLNEAHAYNTVLPALGGFGPRLLMASGERIMMEDLKEEGYAISERRNFLTLDHVSWTLTKLATLHARSLALKWTKPEAFKLLVDPMKEFLFLDKRNEHNCTMLENTLMMILSCLEKVEPQTKEIKKILAYFERYRNKFLPEVQKLFSTPVKDHYVVCHGDPWTNNLMFKHEIGKNGEKGKVVDLKLIDFQVLRYQSPVTDFHYHVYGCANNDVINNHYDDLISLYLEMFIGELKHQNIPESRWRLFDIKWFKDELKKYAFFGVFSGLLLGHAHLLEDDQMKEMVQSTSEEWNDRETWTISSKPELVDRIYCLAIHYMRNFG